MNLPTNFYTVYLKSSLFVVELWFLSLSPTNRDAGFGCGALIKGDNKDGLCPSNGIT